MDPSAPIIGLKTSVRPMVDPVSLDCLFSSEDSDFDFSDTPTQSQIRVQNSLVVAKRPSLTSIPIVKTQIDNLSDATPRITAFLSVLDSSPVPAAFSGQLYFIPEHSVPDELTLLLNDLYHDKNKETINKILACDSTTFPDVVLAQLELIRYLGDSSVDLSNLLGKKIDSRILSLIHFVLAKNENESVACLHAISAIEEMVKFPTLAPLSVFFEGFSLEGVIEQLARLLVSLFPKNPILPSVVHNLGKYATVPEVDYAAFGDSDDDSDFSDSFFESIEQMRNEQNSVMFQGMFANEVRNPLAANNEVTKSITLINEPPSTATYLLPDGTDRMSPMKFTEWLMACRCERQEVLKQVQGTDAFKVKTGHTREKSISSDPLVGLVLDSDGKITKPEDVDLRAFYSELDNPLQIVRQMPVMVPVDDISLYLPLIHTINSTTPKAVTTGFAYPRILINEFEAHAGLLHNDVKAVNRCLAYFSSGVSKELVEKSEKVVFEPLKEKREPLPMSAEAPSVLAEALMAVDYEFVCRGRSPFTGATIGRVNTEMKKKNVLSDQLVRGKVLYYLYVNEEFSPYIAFRLAFALALNIMDSDPYLACEVMFESIYVLIDAFKLMKVIPLVRFGFFCFAEILEALGSFYYGVIALDNFFISNMRDGSYSSAIAQMCVRNHDYLRAAFHYIQGLHNYVKSVQVTEALFVAQVVSGIYTDGGLPKTAISLLSYLLYRTYSITSGSFREMATSSSFGSLKSAPKKMVKDVSFLPDPKSLNTVLLAVKLISLLIKRRMFDIAELLLGNVEELSHASYVHRLTKFCREMLYLKKNSFCEFLAAIPKLDFVLASNASSHLSTISASSFDVTHGTIKLLAVGFIMRRCYRESLFWAEIFIFSCRRSGLKSLGYGYYLRGLALGIAYNTGKLSVDYTDDVHGNKGRDRIGVLVTKTLTRDQVFRECLGSFMVAGQCFEKVGSVLLQVKSYLHFADILFRRLTPETKTFSMEIEPPQMVFKRTNDTGSSTPAMSLSFTAKFDMLTTSMNVMEPLIERLMNPWDIISFEIYSAKSNFIKGKIETAKEYFDFAIDNLTRYFCCGVDFIPKFSSMRKITRFHVVLEHACDVLLWFDSEYINKYLFLFDIMNDVRHTWAMGIKEPTPCNYEAIDPSIDITEDILDLTNPHLPEIRGLLEANGFLHKKEEPIDGPITDDMLKQLAANIHLFEAGKLSEDEMILKNTKICKRLESRSETLRRQRSSQIPVETEFSFAVRACPKVEGCVFIQRIFNKIIIYIPKTGQKRTVEMESMYTSLTVKEGDVTREVQVPRFTKETANILLSLLSEKPKQCSAKAYAEMRAWLFADMTFPTFDVVPDDRKFGPSRLNRKMKGCLATLSCGGSPVIIIPSVDLQQLPFELLLPGSCVIRKFNYTSLLKRPSLFNSPKLTLLRTSFANDSKPIDTLCESAFTVGGELGPGPASQKRISSFLWFAAKRDQSYIPHKFPFVDLVDLPENEMPRLPSGNVLILLTYTDLFTMPRSLVRMFRDYPFASFLFVPKSACKSAMKVLRKIFRRHHQRVQFFEKNTEDPDFEYHLAVIDDGITNTTAIQQTLMKELKMPIPLFIPV